jgi:hypothetical protein
MAVRSADHFISAEDVKVRRLYFGFILTLVFFDWFNLGDEYAYAKNPLPEVVTFREDIFDHHSHEIELPEIIKEKWPSQVQKGSPTKMKELKYQTCEKINGGIKCEEKIIKKKEPRVIE